MERNKDYINQVCVVCSLLILASVPLLFSSGSIEKRPSFWAKVESDSKGKVEVMNNHTALIVRRSLGLFEVTAYCPCEECCGKYADGITASGHIIQKGDRFCAADKIFPFEMKVIIPGYGFVPVLDRGGKITGNRLDVYFDTHKEALEWGRQELEIFCWVKEE